MHNNKKQQKRVDDLSSLPMIIGFNELNESKMIVVSSVFDSLSVLEISH